MPLLEQQRRVAKRMAAASLLTMIVIGIAVWRAERGPPVALIDRAGLALRLQLLPALLLAGLIGNVARLRFLSPDDIGGSSAGEASQSVRDARAILQNSLEQGSLFAMTALAAAAVWDDPAPLLIAHAGLFAAGRLLFLRGFAHGAAARAFGFALSFYPTVAVLLVTFVDLLVRQS